MHRPQNFSSVNEEEMDFIPSFIYSTDTWSCARYSPHHHKTSIEDRLIKMKCYQCIERDVHQDAIIICAWKKNNLWVDVILTRSFIHSFIQKYYGRFFMFWELFRCWKYKREYWRIGKGKSKEEVMRDWNRMYQAEKDLSTKARWWEVRLEEEVGVLPGRALSCFGK